MERRRRASLKMDVNNNMQGGNDALVARQAPWGSGAGSGSGSSSGSSSSSSGSNSNKLSSSSSSSSSATTTYPPLQFTSDLDHFQFACKDISLSFAGGCKPYSLSAFWFSDGKQNEATWVELKEKTWDNSFQWNIIAPVSSQLLFSITDANGVTIKSDDAIIVQSNGRGMAVDTWCQYVYDSAPVPTANIDGSHKYAWNASSEHDGVSSSPTSVDVSSQHDGTATSTYASKVTASDGVDTNATDLNDKSTTISKAIHDANQAKTVEGVLSALLGVSLIAVIALLFLFLKTRRRLREARSQLAARHNAQHGGGNAGLQGVMTEKAGAMSSRREFYSPSSGVITPRAGGNGGGELRNPFDDHAGIVTNHQHQPRSPFLGAANGPRQSVTSLISAVPSNGARSTAGNSAISTEFYHTYKASTIPPRDPNSSNSSSNPFGGMMRGLFAPMSFFSSATPSPNPSRATSRSNASEAGGGDTSTLNTDYYGDRNDTSRPGLSRSEDSSETIHDGASDAITRQSTRSDFTASTSLSGTHLAPSSAGFSTSRRSASLSSDNSRTLPTPQLQSRPQQQREDVYPDSDVASFSNFSFVDFASEGGHAAGESGEGYHGEASDEGSATVVEAPRNPFREPSPGESFNKRRSWNREYSELDKTFLDSTSSFGGDSK